MTDAQVAKALGWINIKPHKRSGQHGINPHFDCYTTIPPFTTSLDAIVKEIEARDPASWLVERNDATLEEESGSFYAEIEGQHFSAIATTAPLALCAALLSYLEQSKGEK